MCILYVLVFEYICINTNFIKFSRVNNASCIQIYKYIYVYIVMRTYITNGRAAADEKLNKTCTQYIIIKYSTFGPSDWFHSHFYLYIVHTYVRSNGNCLRFVRSLSSISRAPFWPLLPRGIYLYSWNILYNNNFHSGGGGQNSYPSNRVMISLYSPARCVHGGRYTSRGRDGNNVTFFSLLGLYCGSRSIFSARAFLLIYSHLFFVIMLLCIIPYVAGTPCTRFIPQNCIYI
jgi:hypothetical protein